MAELTTHVAEENTILSRKFGFWSVVGILLCCSGAWEGLVASLAQSLVAGGSVALVWGWVLVSFGMLFITCALAEMASRWPTSGGQYHWVAELAPPRLKGILSWYTCCFAVAALLLGTISCNMGVAVQVQAYASLAYPDYVPERWHAFLISGLATTLFLCINVFAVKSLHAINMAIIGIHITGFIGTIITLLVCTKDKHDAAFVFTEFQNSVGWSNDGVAWSVGLLTSVYAYFSLDAACHYAEEVENAAVAVPRGMLIQVLANALMTFPFIIVLLYCVGDINSVLGSVIGLTSPFTQIVYNSTNSVGAAIFINALSTSVAFAAGIDLYGAASRMLWTLARDNGLPPWLGTVSQRFDVPINALLVLFPIAVVIPMIYIWNTTAFYGIMAGVLVFFQLSYFIPILISITYARWWGNLGRAPWSLGRFGWMVDAVACCFSFYFILFMSFPVYQPVTAANMNYASAIVGGVALIATIVWFGYTRKRYNGPIYASAVIEGRVSDEEGLETVKKKSSTRGEKGAISIANN